MRARTVNESEEIRIPLKDLTFNLLEPYMTGNYTKRINVPSDFMSNRTIKTDQDFGWWYPEFIEKYGDDGELVISDGRVDLKGNPEFDRLSNIGGDAVSKYYKDKSSGGFTGD